MVRGETDDGGGNGMRGMKERSPFAKTFDSPLVRRAEFDAAIRRRKAYDAMCKRFFNKYVEEKKI
jgi:hypothetical protein